MSHIPSELKYATSHERVRVEANGEAVIGITEHAQDLLGDMVFVDLPDVGEGTHGCVVSPRDCIPRVISISVQNTGLEAKG